MNEPELPKEIWMLWVTHICDSVIDGHWLEECGYTVCFFTEEDANSAARDALEEFSLECVPVRVL